MAHLYGWLSGDAKGKAKTKPANRGLDFTIAYERLNKNGSFSDYRTLTENTINFTVRLDKDTGKIKLFLYADKPEEIELTLNDSLKSRIINL